MPPARLYDCFPFFCELDLLEIRLAELAPHVHRFVLVEAAWDFNGNPKPLHYAENAARFSAYHDKIIHVALHDRAPNESQRWARQRWQRDQIRQGLRDAAPDDLIMISDLDEIPNLDALTQARNRLERQGAVVVFRMDQHEFALDLRHKSAHPACSRMVRLRDLRVPHLVRQIKFCYWKGYPDWLDQIPVLFHTASACGRPLPRVTLNQAGWHLTFIGDLDFTRQKFAAYADDEQVDPATHHTVKRAEQVAERTLPGILEQVSLGELPAAIAKDPARYAHLFYNQQVEAHS
ncbi:MAG: hypothetical protein AAGC81_08955 [Pseudomonadota bacterium]